MAEYIHKVLSSSIRGMKKSCVSYLTVWNFGLTIVGDLEGVRRTGTPLHKFSLFGARHPPAPASAPGLSSIKVDHLLRFSDQDRGPRRLRLFKIISRCREEALLPNHRGRPKL